MIEDSTVLLSLYHKSSTGLESNGISENSTEFRILTTVEEVVDRNQEIVRMIQVIGRPPIIVLGTLGNLLTFFAMQRGSLKNMSTLFYMAILALADTGKSNLHLSFQELFIKGVCYNQVKKIQCILCSIIGKLQLRLQT